MTLGFGVPQVQVENRFRTPNRRTFLVGASLGIVGMVPALPRPAQADGPMAFPKRLVDILDQNVGPGEYYFGDLLMELPIIAETGFSVPVTLKVATKMTNDDHVRRIMVFAPQNPEATVADYILGPRAGKAEVSSRIRLAKTQTVYAVALMSDGRRWGTSLPLEVTFGACAEEVDTFHAAEFLRRQRVRGND
ncbi:MAG: twin-arginine translocation signal domain-containing protein [Alphaproteobacteria bacterium]|nr:twin-arginine translocation signal domain-containing protein [Alphaproteobacteria bacterium]